MWMSRCDRVSAHTCLQFVSEAYPFKMSSDKLIPFSKGLEFNSMCPVGCRIHLHVAISLSTGGDPVIYVQLPEGSFYVDGLPKGGIHGSCAWDSGWWDG